MQLRRTLIGVLALFGALAMPGVADATPGTTATGTLERFPQEAVDAFGPEFTGGDFWAGMTSGTLLPVPGAGQLWQVYTSLSSERTGILVRDSQSLRVLRTFELSTTLRRGGLGAFWSGEWLHATDGGRHVYVVGQPNRLLEIDTATFTVRSLGTLTLAPVDPLIRPLAEVGLTFDPYTGDLLVLYGGPPASLVANRLTVLQRIDLVTGARSTRAIRSCTGPAPGTELGSDTYSPELLLQADAVYVTCQTATLVWPDDVRGAVVRLPRTSLWAADGEESSVATGERVDAVLVDPVGGRIAVLGASSGNVTVVDAP